MCAKFKGILAVVGVCSAVNGLGFQELIAPAVRDESNAQREQGGRRHKNDDSAAQGVDESLRRRSGLGVAERTPLRRQSRWGKQQQA